MKTIIAIYVTALILALPARAYETYSVDWPKEGLRITIDGCTTITKVDNTKKFTDNKSNLKRALAVAIDRAENGCK